MLPSDGTLERRSLSGVFVRLTVADSFTQADVNQGRLRYVHRDRQHSSHDQFVLQLSGGVNTTAHVDVVSAAVTVWNSGLTVTQGGRAVLTGDVLNVVGVDGSTPHSQLIFHVTTHPRLGHVGLNNDSDVSQFTQADLDDRRVFYAQTTPVTGSDVTDSFRFKVVDVSGGSAVAEGEFEIAVKRAVDRRPVLEVNVPVTVIEGYRTRLTRDNLLAVLPAPATATDVVYSVVEPPRHGQLLMAGRRVVESFKQSDIDEDKLEYRSDGSDNSMMDYFLFTLSTDTAAASSHRPLFFSILIQPVTKIPPTIVRVQTPQHVVPLGTDRSGFILSSHDLKATHPLFDSRDVVYQLRTRPRHGYLEHLRSRRPIRRKFSQKDVDDKKIAFVLNEQTTTVTNDSFTFRVVDLNRNYVDNLRYVTRTHTQAG